MTAAVWTLVAVVALATLLLSLHLGDIARRLEEIVEAAEEPEPEIIPGDLLPLVRAGKITPNDVADIAEMAAARVEERQRRTVRWG